MANEFDVFICGSGSAGLTAATWLARAGVRCKIVDSRPVPLAVGLADGIQNRSMEIFENLGISDDILKQGCVLTEMANWVPHPVDRLQRMGLIPLTTAGTSYMPRASLGQATLHDMILDLMRSDGLSVDYNCNITEVKVDESKLSDLQAYPVTIEADVKGKPEVFQAKYALACDGAHSTVRKSLGFKMVGESSNAIWGVVDLIPRTTFPDIRKVSTVHSMSGTLLNIPREGGQMTRFYLELPEGTVAKAVTLEDLKKASQSILHPYEMEFAETVWWSAYSVGQRVADHFTAFERVFLTGDACHTHSPKGGQGMNTSLQDGYNIGWKLAAVVKGQVTPEILSTYALERRTVAENLIAWDKEWVKHLTSMQSSGPPGSAPPADHNVDIGKVWARVEAFSAGLTIEYADTIITNVRNSSPNLAKNLRLGMRMPSSRVIRFCDTFQMELNRALVADGRWRILLFPGDVRNEANAAKLQQLGKDLYSPEGLLSKYTSPAADIDSFIEVLVVLSGERTKIRDGLVPECFAPVNGRWCTRDTYKIYIDDQSYYGIHGHAYEKYGIDPEQGAVVIVRPDGYVSMITELENAKGIQAFFDGFVLPPSGEDAKKVKKLAENGWQSDSDDSGVADMKDVHV